MPCIDCPRDRATSGEACPGPAQGRPRTWMLTMTALYMHAFWRQRMAACLFLGARSF